MCLARIIFVCFVILFTFFPGCGDDERKNCSLNGNADCKEGEECLYSGNTPDSRYCFLPCYEDGSVCTDGLSCQAGARPCYTCDEIIMVCQ